MTPTSKLRFVERHTGKWEVEDVLPHRDFTEVTKRQQTVRILQQWWAVERAGQITPTGEWRDVPIEKETT